MSIEIKCDRCGKPVPAEGEGIYSSRVTPANIIVTKNGHGEMHDLCDDCLQKLDIFMSGKMPAPEYKFDELAYLDLPVSNVVVSDDRSCNRLYLHASMDLDQVEQLFTPYGPWPEIKQVILGVKLR